MRPTMPKSAQNFAIGWNSDACILPELRAYCPNPARFCPNFARNNIVCPKYNINARIIRNSGKMRLEYKLLKNSHLYSCFDFGQLWALFEASYTYGAGSLQDALCCEHLTLFDSCSGNHGQWLQHRSKSQLPVISSTLIHRLLRRLLGKHLPCYVALAMVTEDTRTVVLLASLSSSIGCNCSACTLIVFSWRHCEGNPALGGPLISWLWHEYYWNQ
jgi:hypothetical protein